VDNNPKLPLIDGVRTPVCLGMRAFTGLSIKTQIRKKADLGFQEKLNMLDWAGAKANIESQSTFDLLEE
jgi:hypothetical protein